MATLPLLLLSCCVTTLLLAQALELTPAGKPKYAPFPLDAVELPVDLDGEQSSSDEQESFSLPLPAHHSLPPAWLQFDESPPAPKQRISGGSSKASLIKLPHSSSSSSTSMSANQHKHAHTHQRSCSIEISSKIAGVCQPMSHIGVSACVSGEYMEVLHPDCM
ncbi:uncharacterized protein LOC115633924 [Scaptodrosophila lebanonensis]|uniref:Uncharacterized protein LOC115633924 n=1 Tax=Drosophila lebanonensis TaxID=7225 RepID=A0A6J2UFT5_DROLE|nr:uncharacterized protein LOC115633924 [Scaptodrosophila lebanonensis]